MAGTSRSGDPSRVRATVTLRWSERAFLLARTGRNGEFEFAAEEEGQAVLTAGKSGYRPGEPHQVPMTAEAAPPPVVLTLRRGPAIAGTVVAANGVPLAVPGWASHRPATGRRRSRCASGVTDGQGRFELKRPDPGPVQIFVTGPGRPLSSHVPPQDGEALLQCPAAPATLDLTFKGKEGQPVRVHRIRCGPAAGRRAERAARNHATEPLRIVNRQYTHLVSQL